MMLDLFIALMSSVIGGMVLGAFFSRRLVSVSKHFDRKPFNCQPCCTFHVTWLLSALFAAMLESLPIFIGGVVIAFIVFIIIKYIESEKIEE